MESPLNFSWILPGLLAVGETPPSFADLVTLGFRGCLSLQEDREPQTGETPPPGISFHRVSIRDGIVGGIPTQQQLGSAVEILRKLLDAGQPTYVHCYAGVGRSPTVCMAYLASCRQLTLGEAYRKVATAHPQTAPTREQLAALAEFLGPGRERARDS